MREPWETKALAEHNRVVREFEAAANNKSGPKAEYMLEDTLTLRILTHLLELGGGSTINQIIQDTHETRGKEWNTIMPGVAKCDIPQLVNELVNPGEKKSIAAYEQMKEVHDAFRKAGGIPPFNLPSRASFVSAERGKQTVTKSANNLYFLWCHNGNDWYATMMHYEKKIEHAREQVSHISERKEEGRALEDELSRLEAERESLGVLKFSLRSKLKRQIQDAREDLEAKQKEIESLEKLEASIPDYVASYDRAREKCKERFS